MLEGASIRGVENTEKLGRRLGVALEPGDIVLLEGPLGAGKTALVRGVVAGISPGSEALVSSPTYVVVAEYPTRPRVVHLDLYRLDSLEEVLALGVEEFLYGEGSVALIEWPRLVEDLLEDDDPVLRVRIDHTEEADLRRVSFETSSPRLAALASSILSDGVSGEQDSRGRVP